LDSWRLGPTAEAQKFRITHPFHPHTGREFEALAQKDHGGEHRVCFLDKKGRQCEIPLGWTDLAPEDAIITLAAGIYVPGIFGIYGFGLTLGRMWAMLSP